MQKLTFKLPDKKKVFNYKDPFWEQRNNIISVICEELFTKADHKKVLMQSKQLTNLELIDIFDKARRWQVNSPALFWKLLKERNRELKKKV